MGGVVRRLNLLQKDVAAGGRLEVNHQMGGGCFTRLNDRPSSGVFQAEQPGVKGIVGDDDGRARRVFDMRRRARGDERGAGGEREQRPEQKEPRKDGALESTQAITFPLLNAYRSSRRR